MLREIKKLCNNREKYMNKLNYIDPSEFEENDDFYVPHEIVSVLYRKNPPQSYKVVELEVGKIRRTVNGNILTLYDTINYQYLTNKDNCELKKKYEEYCKDNQNTHDNPSRSVEAFGTVEKDITCAEYDIHKGAIIVNQYNFIQDGLHRSCVILKNYGPKHKIKVLKVKKRTQRRMKILSPLFELKESAKEICAKILNLCKKNEKKYY